MTDDLLSLKFDNKESYKIEVLGFYQREVLFYRVTNKSSTVVVFRRRASVYYTKVEKFRKSEQRVNK